MIAGVAVGHWTDRAARTGCTAILLPEGVAGLWRRLSSGECVATEGARRRKDGTAFLVEIRIGLLGGAGGTRRLALSMAREITGREAFEEKLSHRAFHDPSSMPRTVRGRGRT